MWTLPNLLTLLRLALAPLFLYLYARGETAPALAVLAGAASTDLLDGLAARLLDQRSPLGAVLDPVADKAFAACALFALAARDRLPLWLPLLVVARDLGLLAGALLLKAVGRSVPTSPTRVGKYATFGLLLTALLALAEEWVAPAELLRPWVAAAGMLAALCVVASALQYFVRFLRVLRGLAPEGDAEAGAASARR